MRRGVNVLKRMRHVLLEETSIRERLKVSALGGRIWISLMDVQCNMNDFRDFIRIKIYPPTTKAPSLASQGHLCIIRLRSNRQ